jgi:hypothetical protein
VNPPVHAAFVYLTEDGFGFDKWRRVEESAGVGKGAAGQLKRQDEKFKIADGTRVEFRRSWRVSMLGGLPNNIWNRPGCAFIRLLWAGEAKVSSAKRGGSVRIRRVVHDKTQ